MRIRSGERGSIGSVPEGEVQEVRSAPQRTLYMRLVLPHGQIIQFIFTE